MPTNLPNMLTWLRIALIPLFVAVFYLPDGWVPAHKSNVIASGIFLLAALTDWLDGWLARKLNQMSAFGAFLDPVADKLMVAAALVVLIDLDRAGVGVGPRSNRSERGDTPWEISPTTTRSTGPRR